LSIQINPRKLHGPWDNGYALDVHVLQSVYLGDNEFGHAQFATTRSPVGQLLFQLKYRNDHAAVGQLVDAILLFLGNTWQPPIDAIVPVPPSVIRTNQPVVMIAQTLANRINTILCSSCVTKVKQTAQLKNIFEYDKRAEALKDAFAVAEDQTSGKNLLLFDDLHGSGATVGAIAQILKKVGKAKAVYLLTLTTK
jgi:competence protein ComFC